MRRFQHTVKCTAIAPSRASYNPTRGFPSFREKRMKGKKNAENSERQEEEMLEKPIPVGVVVLNWRKPNGVDAGHRDSLGRRRVAHPTVGECRCL